MSGDVNFPRFLAVWNVMQGQTTPHVHLRMAYWLAARWQAGDTRLLLMAFRSCGKSTITGLFAAWLLWRNPDLRILVLAADGELAGKMVRQTKRIIERHVLTRGLVPERADQWAADRFTVNRAAEWRDPSMTAFGIEANITGSRADVVICDDVEVPNTCDTAEKRAALRERLAELAFVLVPGGTQIYVGTPHAFDTIYATEAGRAPDQAAPYLAGYAALRVPVVADGVSAWPERFSHEDIARLRASVGPRRFGAQMMLQAQPVEDARLSVDALRWHDAALDYREVQGRRVLGIGTATMASASAFWDPAFGRGGDGSVVAVMFGDAQGGYWLQHLEYLRVAGDEVDEATQQCRAVADICRRFHLTSLVLEINGIGRFLPGILRREMGGIAAVVEITHRRPKDLRIVEAFDAVLAARVLHVHRDVAATPFIEEMRGWKPGGRGRDDGLDAVAGALARLPVRAHASKHMTQTAKTDFNVME